jgi:hypothetical protein
MTGPADSGQEEPWPRWVGGPMAQVKRYGTDIVV